MSSDSSFCSELQDREYIIQNYCSLHNIVILGVNFFL